MQLLKQNTVKDSQCYEVGEQENLASKNRIVRSYLLLLYILAIFPSMVCGAKVTY